MDILTESNFAKRVEAGAKALAWITLTDLGRNSCDWMHDFSEAERAAYRAKALAVVLVVQLETMLEESGNPRGFDAAEWLARWLHQRNPSLGGEPPIALTGTVEGRDRVAALLAQMGSSAYA